jgi:hypothetical protein
VSVNGSEGTWKSNSDGGAATSNGCWWRSVGNVRIKLFAKSFILQAYDALAGHCAKVRLPVKDFFRIQFELADGRGWRLAKLERRT